VLGDSFQPHEVYDEQIDLVTKNVCWTTDSRSGGFRLVVVFSFDFEDCDLVKEYRMVRSRSLMFCTVPQKLGDLSSILYIGLAHLFSFSSSVPHTLDMVSSS